METGYDVTVVGAGPAGATASAVLADNGVKTLLIEKENLPRHKICGGAVSKKTLNLFRNADIKLTGLKTFRECRSMQIGTFDCSSVENLSGFDFGKSAGYLTSRREFDYAIVRDAVSKGAELKQNSLVKTIKKENSGFIVEGEGFSFRSKCVFCADGVNGRSAKLLGFRDKWKRDEAALCIESEITDYKHPKARLNFYFGGVGWGYAWIFDRGDCASVGIAAVNEDAHRLKELFDLFMKNCGCVNSNNNSERRAWRIPATGGIPGVFSKGNALLLGDSAGLVDPFLGEGIYYAAYSGKIAAECVINDKIDDYGKTINDEITGRLKYARILAKIVERDPKKFARKFSGDGQMAKNAFELVCGDLNYEQFLKNEFKEILMSPLKVFSRGIINR